MYRVAIAVRESSLFLIATVVRGNAGDVYVNWPRDDPKWKPHLSQHASGQYHHKSFGHKFGERREQKPNADFHGSRNLVQFGVAADEPVALNLMFDPKDFDAVFEIPSVLVGTEKHRTFVYVDLVDSKSAPDAILGTVVQQQTYQDAAPWIVVSFVDQASAVPWFGRVHHDGDAAAVETTSK